MRGMEILLVHSPLVGPTVWHGVVDALSAAGHDAVVPDLRAAALTGDPGAFIDVAVSSVPPGWSRPVVVGHSGAGFFLPSIASGMEASRFVFVDAGLPPDDGPANAGGAFLDHLRTLAVDGVLPRWSTWWGDDAMRILVPDDDLRARIEAELPEIPLEFYERMVDLPTGWQRRPASLVLLSEAYRADAVRARSLGWPVVELLGGHLDVVTRPSPVASLIAGVHQRVTTFEAGERWFREPGPTG